MRRNTSLLALAFLTASALAPAAAANNLSFASSAVCTKLPESGQVQCKGSLIGIDRGAGPAQVQVTVPYHCETGGLHRPPALASGQTELASPGSDGDVLAFEVTTQPIDCATAQPPMLGSQVSLRILQGDQILLEQNVPAHTSQQQQQQQ